MLKGKMKGIEKWAASKNKLPETVVLQSHENYFKQSLVK